MRENKAPLALFLLVFIILVASIVESAKIYRASSSSRTTSGQVSIESNGDGSLAETWIVLWNGASVPSDQVHSACEAAFTQGTHITTN